jgi:DNA-binding beta-propeller fold protein YncE
MRLFPMISGQARLLSAQAGGALVAAALIAGCGNNYRPAVTPVNTTGPASQPTSYAVVVSNTGVNSPGVATIIDYSGDSVMAAAPLCPPGSIDCGSPIAFTIDEIGGTGYTFNTDHTITNFPVSTTLQQKLETVTTLTTDAQPINILAPSSGLWVGDLATDAVDIFTGSPQTAKLSVPVAPATTPAFIAGPPTGSGQRQYVINQNLGSSPSGVECNLSPTTGPIGTAQPIETANYTLDVPIPVGKCPVFALQSADQRRFFVLNRGDDTITVINSQINALNTGCPPPTGCVNQNNQTYFTHPILPLSTTAVSATGITPINGTSGMGTIAGPVYAEYNIATSQLVVANYDGGTISVIDVSLDQYGNDSPTFGTTYTIPVGNNPASVTVLADGSRAYAANQTDGTVTIANLSSHTVEKTLQVVGHPRTVVSTQNSLYGKVYVASPDSVYLTILETTTDLVDTTVLIQGNVVDVRATTQTGGTQTVTTYNGSASISNINYSSRVPGWGQPCNVPPAEMVSQYGSSYTLADCQAIP